MTWSGGENTTIQGVFYSLDKEHNFEKYGEDEVTAFGVEYDYLTAMHYSQHAFDIDDDIPTIYTIVSDSY